MRWNGTELMWHDADMWQHHESRHRPMRAHVSTYVARKIDRAKSNEPTGIVGPIKRIEVRTKAQWATQSLKGGSPYIGKFFVSFLPCGTNSFLDECKRRGSSDTLDQSL